MAYCTTQQITGASGIGVEVFSETLGTGDDSLDSFDAANGSVIAGSYKLWYAAANSNDITDLTETTHYTLQKDRGMVLLTGAGVTALSTNILYIDYIYSPRHSDTLLAKYIPLAEAEVDKMTGNTWNTVDTSIEYFDGYQSGYPQTDKPYGTQIEKYPEFSLRYKGVASITSILFLDRQGGTDRTLDSDEYRIVADDDNQESRLLIDTSIPNGKQNIKVTYTHGYATVPVLVQELTSLVAGLMALANISGGSYKDISTYSFPEGSISIGQIYVNIRESIIQMRARIDEITNLLGGNFGCA